MNPATLSAIFGVACSAFELAAKYGPEALETLKAAITEVKSATGPTLADIEALHAKTLADNAAIQQA